MLRYSNPIVPARSSIARIFSSQVKPQRVLGDQWSFRTPNRSFGSTLVCSSRAAERQPRSGSQRRSADKKKTPVVSEFQPAVYEGMDSVKKFLSAGRCVVVLQPGKSKLFYDGNPVVFGGAVQGKLVGWGLYNSDSMYRVRMLWLESMDGKSDDEKDFTMFNIIKKRLTNAAAIRSALSLPDEETNAYRLINGEGDRLSGVAIDVYSNWVVISSSARWVEIHKDVIMEAVKAVVPVTSEVVWRQSIDRLRQDGFDIPTRASRSNADEELQEEDLDKDEISEPAGKQESAESTIISEYGVKFVVSPKLGQKTGHYLDQRDNRYVLGKLCKGKSVLDTFCYSGGFSLHAALNGATRVDAVDSSDAALKLAKLWRFRHQQLADSWCRMNAELNGVAEVVSLHKADVGDFLTEQVGKGCQWDVVILDPPKLAPSRKDLERAKTKYKKLNKAAMQTVKPGGLLLSCTCSAAMAQSGELIDVIKTCASELGRQVTLLKVLGAGGDHTILPAFPEGQYLCGYLIAVL
ncbi:hypothetical protein GUITHDRAFT_131479 [Guillardia theta CCMP2712]|uniref:S-adenosylmethionine-dependent methyltransferase domain-containing protein n=1 Tax=Guillardia theta (strain CCMP2712) TaxID=905079 RepID=L1K3Q3_GUITC|nr:hypothetical protein GUITHDRAFT_131479 [Guillardia theta CCMP2712]EKX55229.1 hypothetical protein GUITHDRAFT_131479 [Guillardia theta CCMP2712]|eukprot:XP_005842209.1 hypothetical protein GUITHDRAFT_131479 [Guillardia theta CCMP2712]